ncbi:hypothetical protein SAY87_011929 [Trapa incisa]|uniref:Uncharacterized protein n=1 Tax=Trapa incisa TaxID=236973 RepID=A0AAN7H081_9MYRT|nr:hypothetical protein SAY87_011929 [Trapa incisa]
MNRRLSYCCCCCSSSSSSLFRSLIRQAFNSFLFGPSEPKSNIFLNLFLLPPNQSFSLRFFNSGSSLSSRRPDAFTVSYLVERLGLSQEAAQSAAKSMSLRSSSRPDSVVELLGNYSFSQVQISYIIQKVPKILTYRPEEILSPKLDFLRSKGFSVAGLRKVISGCPRILVRSLEGHIIPSFDFISSLIRSDMKTLCTIKRCPSLLDVDVKTSIVPKMNLFREHGVPEQNLGFFLAGQPWQVRTPNDRFKDILERVKAMGISSSKVIFVIAVHVFGQLSKTTWDRKLEVYSRWGWSEAMTLRTFAKYPWCMLISEAKITAVMDYYIREMGLESSHIAEHPLFMSLSLKKRIIPRCSVIKALRSKGLIADINLYAALCMPEEKFLKKYVSRFPLESSNLLKEVEPRKRNY